MKHQPTADQFREQLALAADRIIEQACEIDRLVVEILRRDIEALPKYWTPDRRWWQFWRRK